jgi:hypothetical protein
MHFSRAFRHAGRSLANVFVLAATLALLPACATLAATTGGATGTTGEQKTAVILVNFQDNATRPKTAVEANTLVFGTVSDFLWEASYQQTFLSGDTFGWFTIPVSASNCDTSLIAQEGDRAATAAGANLAAYSQLIYMFPANSGCGWSGTGGSNAAGQKLIFIHDTAGFSLKVIAHEIGHRFGLMHSDALDCDASPLGTTCTRRGYADPTDIMGNRAGHFNAFQKELLGWLNTGASPPITTVASSGRYRIDPYEIKGTGAKALKILKSTDPATGRKTFYYLEYRQPTGFDKFLGAIGNTTSGVMVHTGVQGDVFNSLVLDMTPNSYDISNSSDFEDGALAVGRSYVDSTAGITVTLAAADATGATIDVSLAAAPATCTRAAPTLAVSGPATAVVAGSTVNYTVSLSNKDSSACAATSFNLARTVPGGWSATLAASSLTLSPGASATTILSVTSPGSAVAGSYNIAVGSSSAASGTHTVGTAASYAVAAASITPALTETVGTDKGSYLRGQTVYMSARVLSGGVPASGVGVRFTVILPGGSSSLLAATSGSDGYARSTFKLGKGKAAIGSYQLRADASSGSASASASTSFSAL